MLHSPDHSMEPPRPNGAARHALLPMVLADDARPTTETNDFLEGLLGNGQTSLVYGESNCGKTFFATDLSLHVSCYEAWRGRAIDGGGVLYVAAEGSFGIFNRIAAFRQHHEAVNIPMGIVPCQLDLDADRDRLVSTIAAASAQLQRRVRMVVLDTWSRVLAGGDENSSVDVGKAVRNVDLIRAETGAHVMLIHHSGKDATKGARGHSLLRAALDTEIEITRADGVSIAKVTKQRELPCEGEFAFRLEPVEIGTNTRGKPVTSCVVIPVDDAPAAGPRLTKNQQTMFGILHEAGAAGLTVEEWNTKARQDGLGTGRKADLRDFRAALKGKGLVREYGDRWFAQR